MATVFWFFFSDSSLLFLLSFISNCSTHILVHMDTILAIQVEMNAILIHMHTHTTELHQAFL